MRLYPPVSQLINRVTTAPAMLGGQIPIPARTFVGWNSYGVHVNPQVWGADAQEFVPERWGSTVSEMHARFRRETVRGTYIPFNAHSRKCLGQAFVLLQMKILMFELLRRVEWRVDPGYKLKMTPVSSHSSFCFVFFLLCCLRGIVADCGYQGGILAPLGCRVILTEIQEKEK